MVLVTYPKVCGNLNPGLCLLSGDLCGMQRVGTQVLASRKELVEYEHKQRDRRKSQGTAVQPLRSEQHLGTLGAPATNKQSSGKCYGCASAAVDHCITLLRALATSVPYR